MGSALQTLPPARLPDCLQPAAGRIRTLLRMGEQPPPYNDKPMQIWGQSREQWRQRRSL